MKAERILFPTDFSHAGETALAMATSLARDTGATLLIVHIEEPPAPDAAGELYSPSLGQLQRMLDEVHPLDPAVSCEHRLLSGDPAQVIVQLAEQEGVDVIVMGTHGRSGIRRVLMGSVAEAVVRRAKCPVLTCKQPARELAAS